jgi:hypothetical protein
MSSEKEAMAAQAAAMEVRPLFEAVRDLEYSEFLERANKAWTELVRSCASHGKAGQLTLTIDIKPEKGSMVKVIGDVKTKLPRVSPAASVMFFSPTSGLSRSDPRQMEINGLRVVDRGASAELREPAAPADGLRQVGGATQ